MGREIYPGDGMAEQRRSSPRMAASQPAHLNKEEEEMEVEEGQMGIMRRVSPRFGGGRGKPGDTIEEKKFLFSLT